MVDDGFRVCLDRTVTASACFDSFNPVKDTNLEVPTNAIATNPMKGNGHGNGGEGSSSSSLKVRATEMVECRICQEEDGVHAMEAPCSCSGTLKFAHRRCIQKWCNKKGNITCEICNKVFSPNYTFPPICSNPDVMAIDIRQAWGEHIDLRDSHLLVLAATERQFLESECEDCAVAGTGSVACLQSIGLILMVVLLLHQTLMLLRDSGAVQGSSKFFNVSLLQFAGFLLPCYVMARSWYMMHSQRRRQG